MRKNSHSSDRRQFTATATATATTDTDTDRRAAPLIRVMEDILSSSSSAAAAARVRVLDG